MTHRVEPFRIVILDFERHVGGLIQPEIHSRIFFALRVESQMVRIFPIERLLFNRLVFAALEQVLQFRCDEP